MKREIIEKINLLDLWIKNDFNQKTIDPNLVEKTVKEIYNYAFSETFEKSRIVVDGVWVVWLYKNSYKLGAHLFSSWSLQPKIKVYEIISSEETLYKNIQELNFFNDLNKWEEFYKLNKVFLKK